MTSTQATPVIVHTTGPVPEGMRKLANVKVSSVIRRVREPVLSARVMLTMAADPAVERPALAQATVSVNGRPVRAQADARTMREAVDHLVQRLRVRLNRAHAAWTVRRVTSTAAKPGGRHQNRAADRSADFSRAEYRRAIVPHADVASVQTTEEARAEMEALGYDFLLFVDCETGLDSVIYQASDGCRVVRTRPPQGSESEPKTSPDSVTVSTHTPPTLTAAEAITRLESMGEQFDFYVDGTTGRGNVVYHRYDDSYGLVTPAGAPE